jgi:hypothetical protein
MQLNQELRSSETSCNKARDVHANLLSLEWVGKTDKVQTLHKTVIVSACLGCVVVKHEPNSLET